MGELNDHNGRTEDDMTDTISTFTTRFSTTPEDTMAEKDGLPELSRVDRTKLADAAEILWDIREQLHGELRDMSPADEFTDGELELVEAATACEKWSRRGVTI